MLHNTQTYFSIYCFVAQVVFESILLMCLRSCRLFMMSTFITGLSVASPWEEIVMVNRYDLCVGPYK